MLLPSVDGFRCWLLALSPTAPRPEAHSSKATINARGFGPENRARHRSGSRLRPTANDGDASAEETARLLRYPQDDNTSTAAADPSPIALVAQLASALSDAGVLYCHWKSNAAIERAEQGNTDLDLLVARHHIRRFNEVLSKCGFVAAERHHAFRVPGMADFFGYDEAADRFVHVHAHYQLVLGHDRSKNYRLPIEGPFLASTSTVRVLPTPSPEFEYVVFVIRMVLKYAVLDEILWNAGRGRRTEPKRSEREEFHQLGGAIDPSLVVSILEKHLPFVSPRLFAAAEEIVSGRSPIWRRLRVAQKMQLALEANTRSGRTVDASQRIWRRIVLMVRRRSGARSAYRLTSGGAIIAIIGGDGAGKSTALEAVGDWLGGFFDVRQVHLGKPPWSWSTYVVRAALKVVSAAVNKGGMSLNDEPEAPFSGTRRFVWFACKARDRYRAYRKARRMANRGTIVISDRYPHPALRLMDVPQIARLAEDRPYGRLVSALARFEERYHRMVAPAEITAVLLLDPQEAAHRKRDEPYDYVVRRSTEVWETDWTDTAARVIDASQKPEAVVAALKGLIWSSLA